MVERNIYAVIVPILFVVLIGGAVLFELVPKNKYVYLSPNTLTIVSSFFFLLGIAGLAVCFYLFSVTHERIVKNAFVDCLTRFKSNQDFINKIKDRKFDIKKLGVWEKGKIIHDGATFILALENELGPSKLGYRPNFLIGIENSQLDHKQLIQNCHIESLKNDLVLQVGLTGVGYFVANAVLFIRLPINKKLEYQHLIRAMNVLNNK